MHLHSKGLMAPTDKRFSGPVALNTCTSKVNPIGAGFAFEPSDVLRFGME